MNKLKDILLIGGGGHCLSVIEVIESQGVYMISGIIDVPEKLGHFVLSYPVIGNDNDLKELSKKYKTAHITLGYIISPKLRIRLFKLLEKLNMDLPVIVASTAYVSSQTQIGKGTVIMHQVLVNTSASIGKNCIINNKALIEHDAQIGDHCHISTGALINGRCTVGSGCFIGSGAVIMHGISIAPNSVIGAGAVVQRDIKTGGTWIGNPAKKILK